MPNTNLENAKTNMKSRIRNRAAISTTPRDLGRLAKSARFVGLIDDSEVETELDTQMASAIPSASIDDLVSLSEGINELRDRRPALGGMTSTDQMVEGSRKFLNANSVQPAISVSGDLSYDNGVVSYTTPTSAALQVVATVGDLPAGASPGDQAVVQSNNKLYIKTAEGWYAVALINTAPSVSGNDASYTLATDGTPTVITLTATDPENDPVSFSHSVTSGDLNGTTVDQTDNVFTITPHASNSATFELTFSANDSVNVATAVSSFTLAFAVDFDYTNAQSNSRQINGQYASMGDGVFATRGGGNIVYSNDGNGASGRYFKAWNLDDPLNPNLLYTNSNTNAPFSTWYPSEGTENHLGVVRNGTEALIIHTSTGERRTSIAQIDKPWKCLAFSQSGQSVYLGRGLSGSGSSLTSVDPVLEYDLDGNLLGTFDYEDNYIRTNGVHPCFGSWVVSGDGFVAVNAGTDARNGDWAGIQPPYNNATWQMMGRVHIFDPVTRNRIATIENPLGETHPASQRWQDKFSGEDGKYMAASGNKLLIGQQGGGFGGVTDTQSPTYVYDMTDPTNPVLQHTHWFPTSPNFGLVDAVGNYGYCFRSGGDQEVRVINLTTNAVEETIYTSQWGGRFAVSSDGHIVTGKGSGVGAIYIYPANT